MFRKKIKNFFLKDSSGLEVSLKTVELISLVNRAIDEEYDLFVYFGDDFFEIRPIGFSLNTRGEKAFSFNDGLFNRRISIEYFNRIERLEFIPRGD